MLSSSQGKGEKNVSLTPARSQTLPLKQSDTHTAVLGLAFCLSPAPPPPSPPSKPRSLLIMSWQAYVDSSLVATGHVDKGAILSAAGDSSWAASPDFKIQPAEMKVISAIVSGEDAAKDKAFADGLYIAGNRYVMARADGRSIYARSGRLGVAIAKTKQAIVVGHHGEIQVAGNTSSTVEALADYLIAQGY